MKEEIRQGLVEALEPHAHRHGAVRKNIAFGYLDGLLTAARVLGNTELETEAKALGYEMHEMDW